MASRRKFIAGLGALVTGTAGAVGTGAFTSVQAERDITVEVADDSSAYLTIEAADTDNGEAYVSTNNGNIQLNFDGSAGTAGGSGINDRALVTFEDLLRITNNGTQEVALGIEFGPDDFDDEYGGNLGAVAPTGDILRGDAERAGLTLTAGESTTTGLFFNLEKEENAGDFLEDLETIIFYADAEDVPEDS